MVDYEELVNQKVQRLLESGSCAVSTLMGCSDEEIAELERQHGLALPESYRAFLSKMGRRAGDFLCGTDWEYDHLSAHWEMAVELLETNSETLALPPNAFVFAFHQGYTFLFFLCDGTDDPQVFNYLEPEQIFTKVSDRFTEWFVETAAEYVEHAMCSG